MEALKKALLANALIHQKTALANQVDIIGKLLDSFPLPVERQHAALKAALAKAVAIANKFLKFSAERVYCEPKQLMEEGAFSETLAGREVTSLVVFTNHQLGDMEMTFAPAWKSQVIDPTVEIVRREYNDLPQPDKTATFDVHGFLHYQGEVLLGMLQGFAYLMRAVQWVDLASIREQSQQAKTKKTSKRKQ